MNGHYIFAWDARRHGLPKNYDAAVGMAQELYAKQDGESGEGLPLFADAVDAYLRENGDEDCLEQFLWDLPKRARSNGRAAMRMEMPYEDWEHILVKMVEEAARHQVVLFDEEMVMVFLPDGKVLPAARKKIWQGLCAAWGPDAEFPTSKGQFKKWFEPQFLRVLGKYGEFKKRKEDGALLPAYELHYGHTIQYIEYTLEGSGRDFFVDFWFTATQSSVAQHALKFKFIDPEEVFSDTIFGRICGENSEGRKISNSDEARELLKDLDGILNNILPCCESVKGLDSLLTGW